MRFIVDECAGPALARWLAARGYIVFSIFDEARGLGDREILQKAITEDWIIITADKDFGTMIYRDKHPHHGVVFLRLENEQAANKIAVMREVIE